MVTARSQSCIAGMCLPAATLVVRIQITIIIIIIILQSPLLLPLLRHGQPNQCVSTPALSKHSNAAGESCHLMLAVGSLNATALLPTWSYGLDVAPTASKLASASGSLFYSDSLHLQLVSFFYSDFLSYFSSLPCKAHPPSLPPSLPPSYIPTRSL